MSADQPVQLDVAVVGEGPALVFTHGWLDDRHVWTDVVAALGPDHRCVTWSLRGHGDSEAPPPGHYTREHALADLARIVDLAGTPVVLVGHSLGGYLSLAHTLLHPADVSGLVLIAAGPGFRKDEAREQWNASVEASAAEADIPDGSEVISKHVDSWVIDSLAEIDVPALVVVGERDKRFAASAAVFSKHLDVRTALTVPGAGHGLHRSEPDQVATAIEEFVQGL